MLLWVVIRDGIAVGTVHDMQAVWSVRLTSLACQTDTTFKFCGIVDSNAEEAAKLREVYRVRAELIVRCRPDLTNNSLSLYLNISKSPHNVYKY